MEIVPKGSPKPDREIQHLCDIRFLGCDTEFRFRQSEGKTEYDYDDGWYVAIACPNCNKIHPVWI